MGLWGSYGCTKVTHFFPLVFFTLIITSIASFLIAIPTAPAYNLAIKGGMLSTPLSAINQHDVVQDFQNMLGSLMAISSTTQANFATILSK